MQPKATGISPISEYEIHSPSRLARKLYLYPLYSGYYKYGPGYFITRTSYDSFLLMYLTKGACEIETDGQHFEAEAGQLVLLDCYRPPCTAGEAVLSAQLIRLLDLLLAGKEAEEKGPEKNAVADSIAYINEHFREPVSLELLATKAGISPFHFLRVFSQATGLTPHQYLLSTRIRAARFLLQSTSLSVKRIALDCGFSTEAAFCSTFRKREGRTPSQYRKDALL